MRFLPLVLLMMFATPALAAAGNDKAPAADTPKERFVKMDPLNAPLPEGPRGRRQMLLVLELMVPDADKVGRVTAMMPRIRDAFIRELFARPVGTPEGWDPGDIDQIKQRLLAQGERVVGPDMIVDVLVVHAMRIGLQQ